MGTGLTLPVDVEPYGPGDTEYTASQRLLRRAVHHLGPRFADDVVADGAYATAPFLHCAGALGLHVVARLKGNVPELFQAAQQRFGPQSPTVTLWVGPDWVELWDAADFDPWPGGISTYTRHLANGLSARGIRVTIVTRAPADDLPSVSGRLAEPVRVVRQPSWRTLQQIIKRRLSARRFGYDLIFHRNGQKVGTFYKRWKRACLLAGVAGNIPYDLRRTAVRNMIRAGVPEGVAMSISGHRTRAVFDRYNITSEKDLREAVSKTAAYVQNLSEETA